MSEVGTWNETLVEKRVTYHIEFNGRFVLIENVPARVNVETGEKHFSPEAVERLQQVVPVCHLHRQVGCRPVRTIETQVYEYASLA